MSSSGRLEEMARAHLKPATALRLEAIGAAEKVPAAAARFGGAPYAKEGDSWPVCTGCDRDLTFICQFEVGESNGAASDGLLVFFYCFECFPWGLEDEDRGAWAVRLYSRPEESRHRAITSDVSSFVQPCRVRTEAVHTLPSPDEEADEARTLFQAFEAVEPDDWWETYEQVGQRVGALSDYRTQLGGHPRWVQADGTQDCGTCGKRLTFVAQIDSEDDAQLMWGDVGLVYLFRCADHPDEWDLQLQCH